MSRKDVMQLDAMQLDAMQLEAMLLDAMQLEAYCSASYRSAMVFACDGVAAVWNRSRWRDGMDQTGWFVLACSVGWR